MTKVHDFSAPPTGMVHHWSRMQQLKQENEELTKRNAELVAWARRAYPCIVFVAKTYLLADLQQIVEDAPVSAKGEQKNEPMDTPEILCL